MGKLDGDPIKDEIIVSSFGKFSGLSSKPPNVNHEHLSDLSSTMIKLEVHDYHDSANQGKFYEIEINPTNGFRNNCSINLQPSSGINELASNLSPPDTNREKEPSKQEDSSSPPQHESNRGLTQEFEVDRGSELILMSCLNCYLHVIVSGANPKCPKCGDCLLDMFREGRKDCLAGIFSRNNRVL